MENLSITSGWITETEFKSEQSSGVEVQRTSIKTGIYFYRQSTTDSSSRKSNEAGKPLTPEFDFISYTQLCHEIRRTVEYEGHLPRGEKSVVLVIGDTSLSLIVRFFAELAKGNRPVMFAPILRFGNRDEYQERLKQAVTHLNPEAVYACESVHDICLTVDPNMILNCLMPVNEDVSVYRNPNSSTSDIFSLLPHDFGYLQLTSGTSGALKAVEITSTLLYNNVDSISDWIDWQPNSKTASWLPLYHDMGLVGCLLASVINQTELYLMRPSDFIRAPINYLKCMSNSRINFTAMPTFGLAHICRRIEDSDLNGLDFSSCRALIVGAERIDRQILNQFETKLKDNEFSSHALCPSYGMAEATLAITGNPISCSWRDTEVDGSRNQIASSGSVLTGQQVKIVDKNGMELPDGNVGYIRVESSSAADLVVNSIQLVSRSPDSNILNTGDLGWVRDNNLYVSGRAGDGLKIRGAWLLPEDIETHVSQQIPKLRDQGVVLIGTRENVNTIVYILKRNIGALSSNVESLLDRYSADMDIQVLTFPAKLILKTSSGKPMRQALWDSYVSGEYDQYLMTESS